MQLFRSLAKAALASALLLAAVPASAQFFPFPPGGGYYPQQQPYYQPQYQPQYQPDDQPDYYPQQRPRYRQRQVQYGNACYTSRGTCYLNQTAPVSSICRCFIPGFGKKRGAVINQ